MRLLLQSDDSSSSRLLHNDPHQHHHPTRSAKRLATGWTVIAVGSILLSAAAVAYGKRRQGIRNDHHPLIFDHDEAMQHRRIESQRPHDHDHEPQQQRSLLSVYDSVEEQVLEKTVIPPPPPPTDPYNTDHAQQQKQQQSQYSQQQSQQQSHQEQSQHPPLFPLTRATVNGFFWAVLSLVIAAGGGIGGGGLLVPIYILIWQFSPKHAIPLSNVTVFGGAIANTYLNLPKRHPLADRPLVDWDLILVMEPLTIAGALMGAFLNKLLPEVLLTSCLVLLLGFTAYTTFHKAHSLRRKETLAQRQAGYHADGRKQSELTILHAHKQQSQGNDDPDEQGSDDDDDDDDDTEQQAASSASKATLLPGKQPPEAALAAATQLAEILEYERHTPTFNLQILGALFVVVLAVNLLKGGGAFKSPLGITCGSRMFWIVNGLNLVWIAVITAVARHYLVQRNALKRSVGYPFVEGDIQWNARATLVYPLFCCLAGFCAGMFGIGGGIVKGPLMLAMGVHPAVSSASSACMILFTSFTATTSYMVFGLLVPDFAVACLLTGFVSTLAGQVGLGMIMSRTGNRYSYIAYSVAVVVLLSACLMTMQSLLSMAEGVSHHQQYPHHSGGICGKED